MRYCPITYVPIAEDRYYSVAGLKSLSPLLTHLNPLPYTNAELRQKSPLIKITLPGAQPKLSAQLKVKNNHFEMVDTAGRYLLKPQSELYPELPENEALTMSMAEVIGIEVPTHGLLYTKDKTKVYFMKRFDRIGHSRKLAVEDFAQLSQQYSETKYQSSMEKVAALLMQFTSFPKVEALKLFKLILFNFLVGHEDMHLKKFALITRNQLVTLSPAYDLLSSTLALKQMKTEIALPLNHKKTQLTQDDFFVHFAKDSLQLNELTITSCINTIKKALPHWQTMIQRSFLAQPSKINYSRLLEERRARLRL